MNPEKYNVVGMSMSPYLYPGDIFYSDAVDYEDIEISYACEAQKDSGT